MKMNKPRWKMGVLLASLGLLAACTDLEKSSEQTPQTNNNLVPVETTTNQLSNAYYRALIVDGTYKSSQNRGVSLELNSTVNMKDFESGLLDVARSVFSTDTYYFQEGQVITEEVAQSWLGRKTEDNPDGLNPTGNDSDDPKTRVPKYLSQIVEQDYLVQTEKGFELGGIAIGLAMNQIDYYTTKDEKDRIYTHEQELDIAKIEENAKKYGNQIVRRLRQEEGLESIPIVVGIFIQSPQDSLAGGVYKFEGLSQEGNSVDEWVERKEEKILFPSNEESEDASHFANFKNEIQSFFPNLSGVTGIGRYNNSQLQSLEINIMTQFYGETEIIAFTQHITDAASQYLPQDAQIEIKVESIDGIESFVARDNGSQNFTYHIFD
ncbi:CamS family sex pheromone protein [Jeotgalibaca sp. A122]|uniref:CamS family sex pheromone protein n=1 Tax=Jeotgalibaca sp. A122 TaxID=3457322 RepID=UPI003FD3CDA4